MDRNFLPLNITNRSRSRTGMIAGILVLALMIAGLRYLDYFLIDKPVIDAEQAEIEAQKEAELQYTLNHSSSVSVVAVGNNILDTNLLTHGQNGGTWNYDFLYDHVKSRIESADIAIAAQTTAFTTSHEAVNGYPTYRSPSEFADSLVRAGFDVVASASCHIADFGASSIMDTINMWKTKHPEITFVGIHESQEDALDVKIREVNDIKIAFLNYTYPECAANLEGNERYMLDVFQKELVTNAISTAREKSDCIIFIAHWGDTDLEEPSEFQKQWANYLMDLGVNVIIGTHTMALQPYGTMTDGNGNETTVFYSLGNFACIEEVPSRILSGMARFTIEKVVTDGQTSIHITDKTIEPMIMHFCYDNQSYAVYPLDEYTDSLAAQNSLAYSGFNITVDMMKELFENAMATSVVPSNSIALVNNTSGSNRGNTRVEKKEETKTEDSKDEEDEEDSQSSDSASDYSSYNYSYDYGYGYGYSYYGY